VAVIKLTIKNASRYCCVTFGLKQGEHQSAQLSIIIIIVIFMDKATLGLFRPLEEHARPSS
jgi:hypothetical protein